MLRYVMTVMLSYVMSYHAMLCSYVTLRYQMGAERYEMCKREEYKQHRQRKGNTVKMNE